MSNSDNCDSSPHIVLVHTVHRNFTPLPPFRHFRMFIKSFKQKSNVQLKGSDAKKLKVRVSQRFPNVNEEDVVTLFPNKSTVNQIKITSQGDVSYNIYSVDKRPMFFEDAEGNLIPTLYALWTVPNMVPYFTTHAAVLPKLVKGADLMLPGVLKQGDGVYAFGNFKKDEIVAVNLSSNKAAVGVGRLVKSSYDLYMSGGYGICVKMLHVFGDKLWGIEPSVTLQIPENESVVTVPKLDDFPELVPSVQVTNHTKENGESEPLSKGEENIVDVEGKITELNLEEKQSDKEELEEESMDDVLKHAFLTALKYDGKKLVLPLLTSNFYRLHVIPVAKKQIDLKQTSYKKLSKFLDEMVNKGFIVVREESKGIEKITSINFEHPDLINFIPFDSKPSESKPEIKGSALFHSEMTELYTITDETIVLFAKFNFRKGEGIPSVQVRKLLKEYISKNKLENVEKSKLIKLDKTLSDICLRTECTFDELYSTTLSKMNHTYEMRGKNEVASNKPPIQMSLATRSGNKKVTLIANLEAYGIIIPEFMKTCKLGAAASTTVIKSPNQKQDLLQIQGNQIRFIYNLLTETYKIPARQINGLDLARKEKRKNK